MLKIRFNEYTDLVYTEPSFNRREFMESTMTIAQRFERTKDNFIIPRDVIPMDKQHLKKLPSHLQVAMEYRAIPLEVILMVYDYREEILRRNDATGRIEITAGAFKYDKLNLSLKEFGEMKFIDTKNIYSERHKVLFNLIPGDVVEMCEQKSMRHTDQGIAPALRWSYQVRRGKEKMPIVHHPKIVEQALDAIRKNELAATKVAS